MNIIMNEKDLGKPTLESLLLERKMLEDKKSEGLLDSLAKARRISKLDKQIAKYNLITK